MLYRPGAVDGVGVTCTTSVFVGWIKAVASVAEGEGEGGRGKLFITVAFVTVDKLELCENTERVIRNL